MREDIHRQEAPVEKAFEVDVDSLFACINQLSESQKYYLATRGSHAALLLDHRLEKIAFAEDVGRHNALDKAIGKAFMDDGLSGAAIVVLSSRVSYELVQKAARAYIPVILSASRPTALAVEIAESMNMMLAFPEEQSDLMVVCGAHRIVRE